MHFITALSMRNSYYIRNLMQDVVNQCIDRGECSTQQLVREDILDTLNHARPDIQVGYEVMWGKTKKLFINVGEYLSDKFSAIKAFFKKTDVDSPQLAKKKYALYSVWKPPRPLRIREILDKSPNISLTTLSSLSATHPWLNSHPELAFTSLPITNATFEDDIESVLVKRKLHNWYDDPVFLHFIKEIELLFDELGYDLNRNVVFSESALAGFLYNLWSALDSCGIASNSQIEAVLNLVKAKQFQKNILNGFFNSSENCLNKTTNVDALSLAEERSTTEESAENRYLDRNKRAALEFNFGTEAENVKGATSAGQRPTSWFTSLINYVSYSFFPLKIFKPLSAEVIKPLLGEEAVWNLAAQALLLTRNSYYEQSKYEKKAAGICTPIPLEAINNSLLLADFSLRLISLFFSKTSKKSVRTNSSDNSNRLLNSM